MNDIDVNIPNPWLPIIDEKFTNEPFLSDNPVEIVKNGKYNRMPIIVGQAKNEGIYYASKFIKKPDYLDALEANWSVIGSTLLLNKSSDDISEKDVAIINKIKEFYFGTENEIGKENLEQFIEMVGDCYCFGPNEYFSNLVLNTSAQPLYTYSFDYHGSTRYGDFFTLPLSKWLLQFALGRLGIKVCKSHVSVLQK